jgi:hypothetical protein
VTGGPPVPDGMVEALHERTGPRYPLPPLIAREALSAALAAAPKDYLLRLALDKDELHAMVAASFGDEHDWDAFDRAQNLLSAALEASR